MPPKRGEAGRGVTVALVNGPAPWGAGAVSAGAVAIAVRAAGVLWSRANVVLPGTLRALEQDGGSPALREAAKRETLRRLSADDPAMQAILAAVSAHLGWNPREVKRVVNLVRFHAVINLGSGADTLSVLQLTKLALIGVRWPHLRSVLARRLGASVVLTALEKRRPAGTARLGARQTGGTGHGHRDRDLARRTDRPARLPREQPTYRDGCRPSPVIRELRSAARHAALGPHI